jgi:hypothetical protein
MPITCAKEENEKTNKTMNNEIKRIFLNLILR